MKLQSTIKKKLLITSGLLLCSVFLVAQNKSKEIKNLMQLYYDYDQFNGSILVAENGSPIYKGGFGLANMEWDLPNEADTKHRLGSITKQFTAMLILQLVEQGKIDLQKPISAYLPDYPKETGDKITMHHLLTHTSGIPNYTAFPDFFKDKSRDPKTPDEFIAIFKDLPLEFEPGERFNYSNSAYFLIGVIIEKVTEKTYEANLHELIFDPLGMTNSGYDHHATILKKRATGYERGANGFVNSAYIDMSLPYAAGSLYSTAEDLYKWDQALYTNELITEESKQLLFYPHIKAGATRSYSYGFSVGKQQIGTSKDSVYVTAHGGGINGFNTVIVRDIKQKNLVVLLNNTGGADLGEMSSDIMAILYDKPFDLPKKSLVSELRSRTKQQGLEATFAELDALIDSDEFEISEGELNNFGYQLLGQEKIDAAIAIFKANVNQFPKSANAYDSLGEGYMKNGETEKAIENYVKSLDLNPDNSNGVEMLKQLGADTSKYEENITVPVEILEAYVGKYELMPNFILEVTLQGSQLFIQATGQGISEIFPSSETKFYSKAVKASLTFNTDDQGIIKSLTLHQNGNHEAKKIE